ncbi:MAG: 6-carboxytetrahydropterin synthase [Phycisphaerales bacterium]|nr:6-carboxytetrahydropterin synthase [Phycisphaerales bacterium]
MTIPSRPQALSKGLNTFAGTPLAVSMGAFYEFHATFQGFPADNTGFVFSIYDIDKAIRSVFPTPLSEALATCDNPISVLPRLYELLACELDQQPTSLRWTLNPYHHIEIGGHDMSQVTLTRHYTFSASHRLHDRSLDEAGNLDIFGKCSLPNGHGHNYTLVVDVQVPTDTSTGPDVLDIDAIVMEHVIDKFDHRNLNLDIEQFKAINPTLENITVTCHELLEPAFSLTAASLVRVEVWETDRTSCSYPPLSPLPGTA